MGRVVLVDYAITRRLGVAPGDDGDSSLDTGTRLCTLPKTGKACVSGLFILNIFLSRYYFRPSANGVRTINVTRMKNTDTREGVGE